ncbi:MAG: DegV family protein [Clostridia bacterium]|nr:DegV family protein [Clostridia bacterium]
MREDVIVTDSGSDLEKSLREQFGVEYFPMRCIINEEDYEADLDWGHMSAHDFYQMMRDGARARSAQVNVSVFKEGFKKILDEGKDILYVATSSKISASVNAGMVAKEELLKEYPDSKIIVIDALRVCYALGILVIRASELKAEGKTIEETAAWIEENKLTVNMEGTVENLKYLRQAGRVTAASSFFAGLLNIKPVIIADALGRNFAVEKVKGRRASLNRLAERVAESFVDVPYQRLFISHADCLEDAETLKEMIFEKLGKTLDVHIGYVGCASGTAVGPGMISAHFFGKKVTLNKED